MKYKITGNENKTRYTFDSSGVVRWQFTSSLFLNKTITATRLCSLSVNISQLNKYVNGEETLN